MIQPEPEDLPKDNPKLEIAVLRYDGILSYENEVLQSVFMNKESDLENLPLYDRFVTAEGMHVYEILGTYWPEPAVNEPKVVSKPKVWNDAPIIEEYESDSEDEHVSLPSKEQETPSFANTIEHIKTPRQTDMGLLQKHVLYVEVFNVSLSRWVSFHEKMMAKQVELNKQKGQTATGKESSNPFMAGSLPKTIYFCNSLQSDEDSFELIELMILCTNFLTMVHDLDNLKNHSPDNEKSLGEDASKQGRIDDADAEVTFIDETLNDA
ncbi:hypothetical protein Tco_0273637 [Tanacetum coccineum]